MPTRIALTVALVLSLSASVNAGDAIVEDVDARRTGHNTWRFSVTVRHADEGWDHYADAFTVHAPDGTLLGRRTLHHPHVNEQPFTRSLSGVTVSGAIERIGVRAHDSVHGPGPLVSVELPRSR